MLGVTAIRGRMITLADDGAAPDGPVAVISHRLWRQRFAGASDVVGRQLTVQRMPFTIVGVLPPGFFGPDVGRMADVMVPFAAEPLIRGKESQLTSGGSWWLEIMVRLKPGQGVEQANAALRVAQAQILASATRTLSEPLTLAPSATGSSSLRSRFETPLFAMVVAVGLVLLVACANIAGLLLARALARRRELSVRLALGGSRWRIARLLFIESLLVAIAGAAFGLVFARWSSALLVQQMSTWESTVSLDLALDWRVLGFTAALACLSAITAGVAPAIALRSVPLAGALKDAGRGMAGDRRFAVRSTLVVGQIAVSLILIVAAGLFLRTFASLNRLPLGFEPQSLLVVEVNLQASGGPAEQRRARVERLRDAAATVPGVRSAAVSSTRLLAGGGWATGLVGVGDGPMVRLRPLGRPLLWLNATTPGWFETMGTPLRSGRDFNAADRVGSRPVAIVNEAFVRQYLAGEQVLGQRVRLGFDAKTHLEIVGVVGDAVYPTPREGMVTTLYVPVAQRPPETFWPTVSLTINAAPGQRTAVAHDVAAALTRVDPSDRLHVRDLRPTRRGDGYRRAAYCDAVYLLRWARAAPRGRRPLRGRRTRGARAAGGDWPAHGTRCDPVEHRAARVPACRCRDRCWSRARPGGQLLGSALRGGAAVSPGRPRPGHVRRRGCGARCRGRRRRVGTSPSGRPARSGDGAARRVGDALTRGNVESRVRRDYRGGVGSRLGAAPFDSTSVRAR